MNREIEFRGRTKTGNWVYGSLLIEAESDYFIYNMSDTHPVDPATVGQFIGLFDCKGVKVFQSDAVKVELDGGDEVCVVEWSSGDFRFKIGGYGFDSTMKCEVIGNIFESPELLEEK